MFTLGIDHLKYLFKHEFNKYNPIFQKGFFKLIRRYQKKVSEKGEEKINNNESDKEIIGDIESDIENDSDDSDDSEDSENKGEDKMYVLLIKSTQRLYKDNQIVLPILMKISNGLSHKKLRKKIGCYIGVSPQNIYLTNLDVRKTRYPYPTLLYLL